MLVLLCACARNELPPLPPRADLCISYTSYRYSAPAAAVEQLSAIIAHNTNEAIYAEKCLLDPSRKGGPR